MAAADSDFHALWMQNLDDPARLDRVFADNIWTAGVLGVGSFEVTESSPAALTVDVAAGVAVVEGGDQANQGKYIVRKQTSEDDITIGAAPGSGQRNDLIVLEVRDPNATGPSGDDVRLFVVAGTPSTSPVDPTPPDTCLVLARVRVPSGTGTITSGLIDDLRVQGDFQHPTGTAGLRDDAVTTAKIADSAVTTAKINNLAVTTGKIADSAVTTAKIGDSQVTAPKIDVVPINTQTGNYTLALGDRNGLVIMNSASNLTVTLPTDASVPFPVGSKVDLLRQNTGTVTVNPASGVTRLSRDGRTQLARRYSAATVAKIASNTWVLIGDIG
jgi:hypothetical protein